MEVRFALAEEGVYGFLVFGGDVGLRQNFAFALLHLAMSVSEPLAVRSSFTQRRWREGLAAISWPSVVASSSSLSAGRHEAVRQAHLPERAAR